MAMVSNNLRPAAYDFREEHGKWTVYNCENGCAAVLNGTPQIGLGLNEADDLTALLNRVATQRFASLIAHHLPQCP
jgi:hypothetical protein